MKREAFASGGPRSGRRPKWAREGPRLMLRTPNNQTGGFCDRRAPIGPLLPFPHGPASKRGGRKLLGIRPNTSGYVSERAAAPEAKHTHPQPPRQQRARERESERQRERRGAEGERDWAGEGGSEGGEGLGSSPNNQTEGFSDSPKSEGPIQAARRSEPRKGPV